MLDANGVAAAAVATVAIQCIQCKNTIDSGEGEYYRLSFSLISPFIFSCNDLSSFINDVLSIM